MHKTLQSSLSSLDNCTHAFKCRLMTTLNFDYHETELLRFNQASVIFERYSWNIDITSNSGTLS